MTIGAFSLADKPLADLPASGGGGGNVTLAITGNAATGNVGTVVSAVAYSITGNAATGAIGTVSSALSYAITGNVGTGGVGTVNSAVSYGLTGNQASGFVGSVSAPGSTTIAISGNAATTAVGLPASAVSYTLSGVQASGAAGSVSSALSYGLIGSASATSVGSVTRSGNVTLSITGVSASAVAGSVTSPAPVFVPIPWTTPTVTATQSGNPDDKVLPSWQTPAIDTDTGRWTRDWYKSITKLNSNVQDMRDAPAPPVFLGVMDESGSGSDDLIPGPQGPMGPQGPQGVPGFTEENADEPMPIPPGSGLLTRGGVFNASIANQTGFATDTYLIGSNVCPSKRAQVATIYRCVFDVSKTSGSAAPVITLRYGSTIGTSDAAILTFTFTAGTAATDNGRIEVVAVYRTIGNSATVQGRCTVTHDSSNGIVGTTSPTLTALSASFIGTLPNDNWGISINAGASADWLIKCVTAELINLAP